MDPETARAAATGRFGDIRAVSAACRTIGNQREREMRRTEYLGEFLHDIRPLLQTRCVGCHQGPNAPGNLDLSDTSVGSDGLPGDYRRLAADQGAEFGYPPVIANGTWRQTNASRYIRMFQSRRSLLRKELAWLRRGPPARTSKPKFRIEAATALIADEPAPRDGVELARMATARRAARARSERSRREAMAGIRRLRRVGSGS